MAEKRIEDEEIEDSLENEEEISYDEEDIDSEASKIELAPGDDMRERRYLWIARIFAVFSAVSLCANFILLIAVGNLMPLHRVEPFFATFQNKSEQIVRIAPINLKTDSNLYKVITESKVREYIKLRNTVLANVDEMNRRWGTDGPIKWMSSGTTYNFFSIHERVLLTQRAEKEGFTKMVEIRTVTDKTDGSWEVVFYTEEMIGGAGSPIRNEIIVRLRVEYQSQELVYSDRIKNPLGFKVVQYSYTEG